MQHLTIEEIKSLVHNVKSDRDKLLILVTLQHGLRISETLSLRKGNNIRDGYVSIQRLKGSKKTIQPFVKSSDPDLDESGPLNKLLETLKDGDLLFPTYRMKVWRFIQQAGKKAGIPQHKLHPHALKHSCAMLSIKKIGIENIKQYLGHASLGSTGHYLRITDQEASEAFAGVF